MIAREAVEERERRSLIPAAMKAADSRGRVHPEPEHPYRTSFQRDRDRVIHSTAFRRLEYKTQVFVNHEGDYYRTRLTHTIEVAQIARSIARALGLNEDLTEAVSLSHDLGHTPFGHSGQDALNAIVGEVEPQTEPRRFEHNRQSLRIVDVLERRYPEFPGLNLTFEVRESIAKHAKTSGGATVEGMDLSTRPLLEAQVADASDSIAYDNHDIDDGLKSGLITEEDLAEVALWRAAQETIAKRYPGLSLKERRIPTVRYLINQEVTDIVNWSSDRIREATVDSPDAARAAPLLVGFSPEFSAQRKALQVFLHRRLYGHWRVRRMQIKAERFLRDLFLAYHEHPDQLPADFRAAVERNPAEKKRIITDYVAGMTDRYAQEEYQKLFHPFERV